MATLICHNCKGETDVAPAKLRLGKKYCSVACKAEATKTRPTPGKVEIPCLECGRTFLCYKAWVREGRRQFCNRLCKNRYQSRLLGEANPRYGKRHSPESRQKMSEAMVSRPRKRGPAHPNWKGGRYLRSGYRHLMIATLPEKAQEIARQMTSGDYIAEHRIIAAVSLGRPLKRTEIVHHRNGDKLDNREENLVRVEWGKHSREHRRVERELAALRQENETLKEEIQRLKSLP